jgi:chloramphenicol-sensitive protein RarD
VFKEAFSFERAIGFAFIWTALVVYAADGLWRNRKAMPLLRR